MSTALAQTNDDQVPFTAGGTGVLTGVTKLPGGLTRLNFIGSGNATHLEDYIAPAARIEDNQGNFNSTTVLIGSNEKHSVFFSVSGRFETSKDKCVGTSTGTYTVTGGTGGVRQRRWERDEALRDVCTATGTHMYTGTISKPNSN